MILLMRTLVELLYHVDRITCIIGIVCDMRDQLAQQLGWCTYMYKKLKVSQRVLVYSYTKRQNEEIVFQKHSKISGSYRDHYVLLGNVSANIQKMMNYLNLCLLVEEYKVEEYNCFCKVTPYLFGKVIMLKSTSNLCDFPLSPLAWQPP